MSVNSSKANLRPAGYTALTRLYNLDIIPNWHKSFVATSGIRRVDVTGRVIEEVYPPKYWPGNTPGDHLEFALKYDGTNLAVLAHLFQKIEKKDILDYIRSRPTGKYARRVWFLYELLTGTILPVDDMKRGTYVNLLDPEHYYTIGSPRRVQRQRINNNLPGDGRFCPMIRRTNLLNGFENTDLSGKCRKVLSGYTPALVKRALNYLYSKETKTSYEIEHIKPSSTRIERFIALLQLAEREDFCEKSKLIDLQNRIVDPRFAQSDYRKNQNYVGETVGWRSEKIHYVCPKPEDLEDLMAGLLSSHNRMEEGGISAVVHAAAIAYGFVYLHPFEDGNGRIHRFLIHNVLARRGFTPEGIMFPVSASMLKDLSEYDASLESFSQPLMALVDYSMDEEGRITVDNDTALHYRFMDLTVQAEALFRFIERTIDVELAEELFFLEKYDRSKKAIQEIVDMPDRQIDLFIRFCLQQGGRLSARKRASHFTSLTDDEVARMEGVIRSVYETDGKKDA